jgi:YHS domain-containing protein
MFGLIGWLGRIILIVLIIRLIVSMFSGGARRPTGSSSGARGPRGPVPNGGGDRPEKAVSKLVRDPQCGTYVAESTAIAARHGGVTLHFCSARCRDEYLASPRATAS